MCSLRLVCCCWSHLYLHLESPFYLRILASLVHQSIHKGHIWLDIKWLSLDTERLRNSLIWQKIFCFYFLFLLLITKISFCFISFLCFFQLLFSIMAFSSCCPFLPISLNSVFNLWENYPFANFARIISFHWSLAHNFVKVLVLNVCMFIQ